MPLIKDLFPELAIDYTDGIDVEGVEVPADVMKKIYERISPDELTPQLFLNECLAFGLLKREEDSCLKKWAREDDHKLAQEYGRMGRKKANAGVQIMWDSIQHEADRIWKRNYALSKLAVAGIIARNMEDLPPEDRRSVRTIRDRIKKPKKT